MGPVPESLASSLRNLEEQIEAAEKLLQKMPGAARASFPVGVKWEQTEPELFYELSTQRQHGRLRIVVSESTAIDQDGRGTYTEPVRLVEYPTSIRIELAAAIPRFIELASLAGNDVAKDADEVATAIEQAIAQYSAKPNRVVRG